MRKGTACKVENEFTILTLNYAPKFQNSKVQANIMGTYVKNNAQLDAKSNMDEDGIFKEAEGYLAKSELNTEQLVSGAQQYLSYTYIDEEATQLNKGKTVYVTTVVMVINKELFSKALEDVAKEKPLNEQLIKESKKGVIALVRNVLKKK